jgi:hypothetical protein
LTEHCCTEIPASCTLGEPVEAHISIKNRTSTAQEIELSIANCENFFFSGSRVTSSKVEPSETVHFRHTLIPIKTGRQAIPQVKLVAKAFNAELPEAQVARYIFVKPNDRPT